MNERIQELAEQAELIRGVWAVPDFILERFAESIVLECVHLADTLNEAYDAPSTAGKFIKQHFGIDT